MVKLKDIAKLAGVSIPTVNQILNGYESRFSEKTCKKVFKATEELSYRPNIAARSLRYNKTYTVGILFFSANSMYLTDFMHATQYSLLQDQYAPIFLSHSNAEEEARNLEICLARQVDGLIVNVMITEDGTPSLGPMYQKLINAGMPVVEIFGNFLNDIPHFHFDHYRFGYELTERLILKGCRKIAFLTHSLMGKNDNQSKRYWNAWERWHGYETAIKKHNIESLLLSHHLEGETDTEGCFYWNTYEIAEKIFNMDSAPDGIVCSHEEQALALVNYANNHGIDLNKFIIGTTERSSNNILDRFPVETITWPTVQLGEDAVNTLMSKIKNKS